MEVLVYIVIILIIFFKIREYFDELEQKRIYREKVRIAQEFEAKEQEEYEVKIKYLNVQFENIQPKLPTIIQELDGIKAFNDEIRQQYLSGSFVESGKEAKQQITKIKKIKAYKAYKRRYWWRR